MANAQISVPTHLQSDVQSSQYLARITSAAGYSKMVAGLGILVSGRFRPGPPPIPKPQRSRWGFFVSEAVTIGRPLRDQEIKYCYG